MRYQMKNTFFSMTPRFTIFDDQHLAVYFCEGRCFSLGDKLSFRDAKDRELAYVEQKLFRSKQTYLVYREDQLFAEIVKEPRFFRQHFTVDIPGPNNYSVRGDCLNHEYEFLLDDQVVAQISRAFFPQADTYGVDIVNHEDDLLILAVAIVIDSIHSVPNPAFSNTQKDR